MDKQKSKNILTLALLLQTYMKYDNKNDEDLASHFTQNLDDLKGNIIGLIKLIINGRDELLVAKKNSHY